MEIVSTAIPGCLLLKNSMSRDSRGTFLKNFQRAEFLTSGLPVDFEEVFFSCSHAGVVRGMHFQIPPFDHVKLVTCLNGRILDAVVDLRRGSPTESRHALIELSAESGDSLVIPTGLAHGFLALADQSLMQYCVSSPHSITHDKGIHWNSAGIPWPVSSPTISERDRGLPPLSDYVSPFQYSPTA